MLETISFIEPILLSLKISLVGSMIAFVVGFAVAWYMVRKNKRFKAFLETLFMLPIVLPPTVIGLLLLLLLGRQSGIGGYLYQFFGTTILFTWWAGVIASFVVAFPLVYSTVKVGLKAVDQELEEAGRSQGANEWQVLRYITLPLTVPSLLTAYVLAFARGLGEFGATIMIAGNIPGKTQTVATAIYTAVDSGNMKLAVLWSISIIVTSFLMLAVANIKK